MVKSLVIVESPAKAKTIGKFLGRSYVVKASYGHLRDLPKSQLGVAVENSFAPKFITIRGKGEIVKDLRDSAKKVDRVLLASDPDREGEAIAWELAELLGIKTENCRIEFHEITQRAIQDAVKKPRSLHTGLVDAYQARRVLDRIVGYKISPLLWAKVRNGLSAGRVQSPTVRLICEREDEIRGFVPEEYWTLVARLSKDGETRLIDAKLTEGPDGKIELHSAGDVGVVLRGLEGCEYSVGAVKRKERRRNPAAPFTTSSLQQEASRRLGFAVRRTMSVAQQLYEGLDIAGQGTIGLISYMRTDSVRVAEEAQAEARQLISDAYGPEYIPEQPPQYKSKPGSQGAHEAVRPTSVLHRPEGVKASLSRDQYRLYRLIWERFVASQMSPAVLDTVTADIKAGAYSFRATGSIVKFQGFMSLYTETTDEETSEEADKMLPPLSEGELLGLQKLEDKQHFTQPPARYSEAMLVRALEEKGIGRPSTYAQIIETISKRGYASLDEKRFVPTDLGYVVVDLIKEHFPDVIDVGFTAHMEDQLDKIEDGDVEWVGVIRDFYGPFSEHLERATALMEEVALPTEETDETCDSCGRNLVVKQGRYGRFLACPGFPECKFTKPVLRSVGVQCPLCSGEVVERRSKRGRRFFGCSRYPECAFVVWDEPTQSRCPVCSAFMVRKRGKKAALACSRPGCDGQSGDPSGPEALADEVGDE